MIVNSVITMLCKYACDTELIYSWLSSDITYFTSFYFINTDY